MAAWLKRVLAAASAVLLLIALPAQALPSSSPTPLAFSASDPLKTDTGHTLISWNAGEPVTLEIAQAPDFADARTLYSGRNKAFFVSGLTDGDYLLRLRGANGEISAPLELKVHHQSLQRALWLALVGAIVTLAIIAVILRGARDD